MPRIEQSKAGSHPEVFELLSPNFIRFYHTT